MLDFVNLKYYWLGKCFITTGL